MLAKTLMIQGTASNVGKSVVAAAFCRIFKRKGFRVAPFKAQNMSNNSYVTADGEIGRAQAVQAEACDIEPTVWMNPVLLKPSSDSKAQIVVEGKVRTTLSARGYHEYQSEVVPIIDKSLNQLRKDFEIIVIEGAGSPAEMNMKDHDIVNMRVAKRNSTPVILVGDIDKGGIFAQIVGTFDLLEPDEQKLVVGFIINKFRGDLKILQPGINWIEQRIQKKCLGVLPFISDLNIDQEDSVVLDEKHSREKVSDKESQKIIIEIIKLPRISNFTDFNALSRESDVILQYINAPRRHGLPDLVVIPGTKSTMEDLKFLRQTGLADYIKRCARAGVSILGICGGYQMLGEKICDPKGIESAISICDGLALLPVSTTFQKEKKTVQVKALHLESQLEIKGYEIHMGQTRNLNGASQVFKIIERQGVPTDDYDGFTIVQDGIPGYPACIWGTYIHGLFDDPKFRHYFLNKVRQMSSIKPLEEQQAESKISVYDQLADDVEKNIDMQYLNSILNQS